MTSAIDITPEQRKTLLDFLRRYLPGTAVWAYGSRVKWTARPNSDLDLVAFAKLEQRGLVAELKDALNESNLPFLVDLHVWDDIPEKFHEIIRKEYVVLQEMKEKRSGGDISGDWKPTTLGECADWLSGGTPFKGNSRFWSGSIPWVSAKDMKSFRLHDAEDHISDLALGNGGKVVPAGTILVLVRGMTLHNDVPICIITREMAFNQDIKALRPAKNVDGAFLAYWLLANKPDLLASVDHAGHGTGRLVTDTLKEKPVQLPPLAEQKAIAAVLGALDDKIELNRRMNATLEGMARALFRSWFVDFDPVRAKLDARPPAGLDPATAALFPTNFQDSPFGPIPHGWTVTTLGRACEHGGGNIQTGPFGTQLHASDYVDEGVPSIMPSDLRDNRIDTSSIARVREEDAKRLSVYRVQTGDVVYSRRGDVERRSLIRQSEDGWLCGTGCLRVRFGPRGLSPFFGASYLGTLESRAWVVRHAVGATMPNLNTSILGALPMIVPPAELQARFAEIVGPWDERGTIALDQSRSLATLRDTLLPKLLSGELSAARAENEVSA